VRFLKEQTPEPGRCSEFKTLISTYDLEVDQTVSTIQELIRYSLD